MSAMSIISLIVLASPQLHKNQTRALASELVPVQGGGQASAVAAPLLLLRRCPVMRTSHRLCVKSVGSLGFFL